MPFGRTPTARRQATPGADGGRGPACPGVKDPWARPIILSFAPFKRRTVHDGQDGIGNAVHREGATGAPKSAAGELDGCVRGYLSEREEDVRPVSVLQTSG